MHVLGRVEKFRDRLQLEVRALEPSEADPATLAPALRRDGDELEGFLEFLTSEIHDDGVRTLVTRVLAGAPLRAYPATPDGHHSYAGGLLEHTVGVATICRELTQLHPRLRADLLLAAALVHDVGRTRELGPPPAFAPPKKACCSDTCTSGCASSRRGGAPAGAAARRRRTSRPARRANCRGRGALPRESARRSRGDATGSGIGPALALAASLSWGFADFFGAAQGTRRSGRCACFSPRRSRGSSAIGIAVAIRGEGPAERPFCSPSRRRSRDARAVRATTVVWPSAR